ncbi:hypothetical protein [Comamonas sp. JC664]
MQAACEQLSAWVDGELDDQALGQLLAELPELAQTRPATPRCSPTRSLAI